MPKRYRLFGRVVYASPEQAHQVMEQIPLRLHQFRKMECRDQDRRVRQHPAHGMPAIRCDPAGDQVLIIRDLDLVNGYRGGADQDRYVSRPDRDTHIEIVAYESTIRGYGTRCQYGNLIGRYGHELMKPT